MNNKRSYASEIHGIPKYPAFNIHFESLLWVGVDVGFECSAGVRMHSDEITAVYLVNSK